MPVEYSSVGTVILSESKVPKEEKENRKTAEKTGKPQKAKDVCRVDPKRKLVSGCPLKRTIFSLCGVKPSVLVCGVG